ncbi:hypothetical protein WN11_26690 (plasmid) [Klebsiella pneumoniae]|nr:hypothetical protein WN11_26690 [Klebsiella pneumoniae]
MTQRQQQACCLRSGGAALSRRGLRSLHPVEKQRPPGCKAHRRFACRAPTLRRVPALFRSWCITRLSPFRLG